MSWLSRVRLVVGVVWETVLRLHLLSGLCLMTERVVVRKWNRKQTEFLQATERFVCFEGAIRAGKTTPAIWKMINACVDHPRMRWLMSRWTGDALEAQLKPKFYEECPRELLGRSPWSTPQTGANGWNGREEYQEFTNGSLIYMRSIKSADDNARYAKHAGLTLGGVYLDQPEEVPVDHIRQLKGRISQPGFPQQMLLTPNPPGADHWLTDEFPDGSDPGKPPIKNHRLIHTSMYDNRDILGDEYIAEAEREYPPNSALRRRMVEGLRGLATVGEPVYGGKFSRSIHVQPIDLEPDYPLIESWDFGQKHPAVLWSQFLPGGLWNVLAEWMGDKQFLDEVVPAVAARRAELFPKLGAIRVCCDPAGANPQGHGVRHTAVDVLNTHLRQVYGANVGARYLLNANRPEKREWAIQQVSAYMSRLILGRPAYLVHPRCEILIDGDEAGYIFDDRKFVNAAFPNIRRPKKDGYYDHLQNCKEYTVLNFGQGLVRPERVREDSDLDEDDIMPTRKARSRAGRY